MHTGFGEWNAPTDREANRNGRIGLSGPRGELSATAPL
jgi:hypothetical protein